MNEEAELTLFHSRGSRSGRTKMLLDLLEVPYELQVVDIRKDDHKRSSYLTINPFGVVPTLKHGERVILESAAQMMYLADLYPEAGMAPPLGSRARAAYYEMFVLGPSIIEPTVVHAWRHPDESSSGEAIRRALSVYVDRFVGPYFLGEQRTAVDIFLHWSLRFFPPNQLVDYAPIAQYCERMKDELDWTSY